MPYKTIFSIYRNTIRVVLFLVTVAMLLIACDKKNKVNLIKNAVTDVDGNSYDAVKIGKQIWMAENLRTTHYADGTEIPLGRRNFEPDDPEWSGEIPFRYVPGKDDINISIYGYYYNWGAVMHGANSSNIIPSHVQGICPNGWHVPSIAEWEQLIDYVSNENDYLCCWGEHSGPFNCCRYYAKSLASTTGWTQYGYSPTMDVDGYWDCNPGTVQSSNNATGFSALPAGFFSDDAYNNDTEMFGVEALFWSSTKADYDIDSRTSAMTFQIYNDSGEARVDLYEDFWRGLTVRCVKD